MCTSPRPRPRPSARPVATSAFPAILPIRTKCHRTARYRRHKCRPPCRMPQAGGTTPAAIRTIAPAGSRPPHRSASALLHVPVKHQIDQHDDAMHTARLLYRREKLSAPVMPGEMLHHTQELHQQSAGRSCRGTNSDAQQPELQRVPADTAGRNDLSVGTARLSRVATQPVTGCIVRVRGSIMPRPSKIASQNRRLSTPHAPRPIRLATMRSRCVERSR